MRAGTAFHQELIAMAEANEIKASARPRAGKGRPGRIRRQGNVPGVLYGDKAEPQNIALDFKDLVAGRGSWQVLVDGARSQRTATSAR